MSRRAILTTDHFWRFPRVSGDEPRRLDARPDGLEFSPRERG